MNPDFINPLVLAYLGDSVLELLVRDYLVKESELKKVNELCQEATHFVSSLSHEKFILHLLEIDFLTEKEVGIFKRGRNTKTSKRDTKEHRYSTGFECLIGHLYLNECKDRIYEIFYEFKRYVNETNLRRKMEKNMKQYIYGKNPIMEALKGASVYKIYMLNGHKDPKIFDICKRNQIPLEFVDKKEFDKKVGKVVHQGVMAYIENYRYYTIDEILKDIPENKQPLLLMLDGLEDPHNLGAILRTCDAVGVDGVIIGKNRSVGLNGTVAKVSTGAIHHVKVAQVTNLTRTLEDLKKKAFWVVGCELENSQDYRSVDYNMPTVLVIGSEGFGMSRLVKKSCDINVVLPMVGHVNSLNASVAASVLLYQVYNSRHPL